MADILQITLSDAIWIQIAVQFVSKGPIDDKKLLIEVMPNW